MSDPNVPLTRTYCTATARRVQQGSVQGRFLGNRYTPTPIEPMLAIEPMQFTRSSDAVRGHRQAPAAEIPARQRLVAPDPQEHRLVYEVEDDRIVVLAARFHYGE